MGTTTPPVRAEAPGRQFPMAQTIGEALPLLRRPFSASAVRAKVQNQDRAKPPNWGQIARYIDARLVSERLNLVAGGEWSYEYAPLDPALRPPIRDGEQTSLHVVCSLTVLGETHTDVGEGRDPKGAFSDALKRAAVPFGIGRSIYAVPRRFLFAEESKRPPGDKLKRKGERHYLTEANELLLREEYGHWLEQVGIAAFGEPLDHGPDQAEALEEEEDNNQGEDGAEAAVADAPTGGLRAVSDGQAHEPPATIHERRRLMALIASAGYQGADGQGARCARARRAAARPPGQSPGRSARADRRGLAGCVDHRRRARAAATRASRGPDGELAAQSRARVAARHRRVAPQNCLVPACRPVARARARGRLRAGATPARRHCRANGRDRAESEATRRPVVLHQSVHQLRRSTCRPSSNVSQSPTI